ncbi:MAG: hypothetical protein U0V03_08605 [Bacteroidia bacterium]
MTSFKLFILLVFSCYLSYGQTDNVYTGDTAKVNAQHKTKTKNNEWKKKFFFGGMITPVFSSYAFYVAGNPHVGYRVSEKLSVAAGATGIYTSQRIGGIVYRQGVYGPFAYSRYFLTPNFFGQVQYELLSQQNYLNINSPYKRVWQPYGFFGGGYMQKFGDRSGVVFSILYNVYANQNSVYSNPLVQIGFNFGL